jgi:hypothetical protein
MASAIFQKKICCKKMFSLMANFSKVKDAFEFGLFLSLLK